MPRKKILFTEDDPLLIKSMRELLSDKYTAVFKTQKDAENEIIQKHGEYNLIVIDYEMVKNGYNAINLLDAIWGELGDPRLIKEFPPMWAFTGIGIGHDNRMAKRGVENLVWKGQGQNGDQRTGIETLLYKIDSLFTDPQKSDKPETRAAFLNYTPAPPEVQIGNACFDLLNCKLKGCIEPRDNEHLVTQTVVRTLKYLHFLRTQPCKRATAEDILKNSNPNVDSRRRAFLNHISWLRDVIEAAHAKDPDWKYLKRETKLSEDGGRPIYLYYLEEDA